MLEKWVAERFRHTGIDPQARPEIGSGSGRLKGDIATKLPITIECKNTRTFKANKFMRQVEKESLGYQDFVIIWHPCGVPMEDSKVFMTYEFFEKLLKSFFNE